MGEEKTIALNRRARHEFSIEDTVEAGIVLTGTEIKALRAGKGNLSDAYARIDRGEAWLVGAHIAPWSTSSVRDNHEPKRDRKLLLHRSEIDQLLGKTRAKGLTLIPLRLYISQRGGRPRGLTRKPRHGGAAAREPLRPRMSRWDLSGGNSGG